MRTFVTASIIGAATLAFVGAASAQIAVPKNQEFYATPIQKGAPTDLPGERLIPGASQSAALIDTIISPIVVGPTQQLGTTVGGGVGTTIAGLPTIFPAEPAAAPADAGPAPRAHRRHHHRYGRHSVHAKSQRAQHIGGE